LGRFALLCTLAIQLSHALPRKLLAIGGVAKLGKAEGIGGVVEQVLNGLSRCLIAGVAQLGEARVCGVYQSSSGDAFHQCFQVRMGGVRLLQFQGLLASLSLLELIGVH